MTHKVILIVIDGLAWQVAESETGYLHALAEAGAASILRMQSALPTLSRPLYECLLTGATPVESGILHNGVVRLSTGQSLFHLAAQAGLKTAAAAYYWISELYNRAPYVARRDRFTNDPSLPIQHGVFYQSDDYPDSHLFLDAAHLLQRWQPDFLLVHPMGVDDAGHHHGLDSPAYRHATRRADLLLSDYLPEWRAAGYQTVIVSDHGMTNDRAHGGCRPEERDVPLILVGDVFDHDTAANLAQPVAQTEVFGFVAGLLGVATDNNRLSSLIRNA